MFSELITPQTAAANSSSVNVGFKNRAIIYSAVHANAPISILATGLGASETIALEVSHDGGTTWTAVQQNGSAVELSSTNNLLVIDYPGTFRFVKGVTAAAAGLYLRETERHS